MTLQQSAENAIFGYPKDPNNNPPMQGVADLFRNARHRFDTVAEMVADTGLSYSAGVQWQAAEGDIVLAGAARFQVAASGASDHHVATAGAVKLYALDGFDGSVALSGVTLTAAATWRGIGKKETVLDGDGSTILTLSMGADEYITLSDMRLKSTGATLIDMGANAYFTSFERVWFGDADVALDIDQNIYWSAFTDCVFRDNKLGFSSVPASGEKANAVSFVACTFYHYDVTQPGVTYSVSVKYGDGITLAGCQVQNQGMKFDSCDRITLTGGYWECYDMPALTLVDSAVSVYGTLFKSATKFTIDAASAERWEGISPNISAQDSGGIEITDYHGGGMPFVAPYRNIFEDYTCSTQAAADTLGYSPTGATGAASINGSGHLEIAFSASNQRLGKKLTGASYISGYIKWRATADECRLTLGNVAQSYTLDHDSAADSEWRYSYFNGSAQGGDPYFIFQTTGAASGTVEIDTIILTDQNVAVREKNLQVRPGPVDATNLSVSQDADVAGTLTAGKLNTFSGSPVVVAPSATETLYTFSDYGTYLVQVDQGTFMRTDQTYWTGVVVVGSNGDIAWHTWSSQTATIGKSGLSFQLTNTSGSSRTLTLRATKIG